MCVAVGCGVGAHRVCLGEWVQFWDTIEAHECVHHVRAGPLVSVDLTQCAARLDERAGYGRTACQYSMCTGGGVGRAACAACVIASRLFQSSLHSARALYAG